MKEQNYTDIEKLFVESETMLASGKMQGEVAERFGFLDK